MEQRLSLVTLGVRDLPRARAFYEALGWRTGAGPDDVRDYHAGAAAGSFSIVYRATSENGTSPSVTQAIAVDPTYRDSPNLQWRTNPGLEVRCILGEDPDDLATDVSESEYGDAYRLRCHG